MPIALQLERLDHPAPPVPRLDYHWDAETAILSARLDLTRVLPTAAARASGRPDASGDDTVELCGADGSWLMLDVRARQLQGVEVAVWPELTTRPGLQPPRHTGAARACVPQGQGEVATVVVAESDEPVSTLHFRVGRSPVASTVCLGGDFLLDLDARSRLAGLWLLNVPPAPTHA